MELNEKNILINKELIIENDILMENLEQKKKEAQELKEKNQQLENINHDLREQLDAITYSRSYKLTQALKKIVKRS